MKRILFTALLLGVVGCNPAGKFSVLEAGRPVVNGLRSLHGKATVESSAGSDFVVESALFVVRYKERELATARLMLPIEVPAKGVTAVRWDLALENLSPATLQTLQTRALMSPAQVKVDVRGYVRYGRIRKKIEIEDVPFTQIIANFGALQ